MRILHVAALPFPSPQGTQAAVRAMAEATAIAGDSHLLVYAEGAADVTSARFTLHRASATGATSSAQRLLPAAALRSGPSFGKLARDLGLVRALWRLGRELRPDLVCAHHVEACAAALVAGVRPLVFVAHTALAPELPTYLSASMRPFVAPFCARAGDALDTALARRADAVMAVSPVLAERLAATSGVPVRPVAVPWAAPPPLDAGERARARAALGFDGGVEIVLYAGNLDGYQGLACMLAALSSVAVRRPALRLLVATASDARALRLALGAAGLASRTRIVSLEDEVDRRLVHAAADVALVPRGAEGGVPIKLLDALARGVSVVAQRRATAGMAVGDVAFVCDDDDAMALGAALEVALDARPSAHARAARGRARIADVHAPEHFAAALAALRSDASQDA